MTKRMGVIVTIALAALTVTAQLFSAARLTVGSGKLKPKTIRTDEPTERVDRKFLETLVELDPGAHLPMRRRVDTFILTDANRLR